MYQITTLMGVEPSTGAWEAQLESEVLEGEGRKLGRSVERSWGKCRELDMTKALVYMH